MNEVSSLIKGAKQSDVRGKITFVNDFDMSQIKRFYIIEPSDTKTIRAWRAHRIEQRWFHVTDGAFLIRLVKLDNWDTPSQDLPIEEYRLQKEKTEVLHIPAGYASSVQALVDNSKLVIFADYGIENVEKDNYLFPEEYWETKEKDKSLNR